MNKGRWTPELLEYLSTYAALNISASEIAGRMTEHFKEEFTRMAVMGACHRNKIPLRSPEVANNAYWGPRRTKERKVVVNVPKPVKKPIVTKPKPLPVEPVAIEPIGIDFADIQNGQCRYPLWGKDERADYKLCGAECVDTYCTGHRAIVYTPARRSLERIVAITHN